MSPSEVGTALRDPAALLEMALRRDPAASLPDRDLQRLFAALVRAYAARREESGNLLPFAREDGVSATEVAVAATGLLEAAEMAVFELGMWQTIKGRG